MKKNNFNGRNEINSLILCKKCKTIPLIELVPKDNKLKILLTCKCSHQNLIKSETFLKYYYINNYIDLEIDEKRNKIKEEKINRIINNYQEYKNNYLNNLEKIKEGILEQIKSLEKRIVSMIDLNKNINENIDKIIQILIKNYRINQNYKINKENILNNIHMNSKNDFIFSCKRSLNKSINDFSKTIQSYLKENYIITDDKYKIIQSLFKFDFILEINKKMFLTLREGKEIKIFDKDNYKNQLEIKNDMMINNLLIDERQRYLISVENNSLIKFRDFNEIKIKISQLVYEENKSFSPTDLLEFKHEMNIKELISLENNLLVLTDGKSLNIYKYDINAKSSKLINKSDIKALYLKIIKRRGKIYISYFSDNYIYICEIPSLINKNKIECGIQNYSVYNKNRLVYEQINENEILLGLDNKISLINLDTNKKNISKKINFYIMSVKVLNDNTILIGGRSEIKRLYMKTLEDLPCLIRFEDDDEFDEDYYYGFNLQRNEDDVNSINQLSDGKLLLKLTYDIKIYGNEYN